MVPQTGVYPKVIDTLNVLTASTYEPYEYFDGDTPKGIFVDYINIWSKQTGVYVNFVRTDTPEGSLRLLNSGKIHCTTLAYQDDIEESYLLSLPIMDCNVRIFHHRTVPNIKSLENMHIKIGVVGGTAEHTFLANKYPDLSIKTYKKYKDLVDGAIASEIKYFAINHIYAKFYLDKSGYSGYFKPSDIKIKPSPVFIAVRKEYPEILPIINQGIRNISEELKDSLTTLWSTKVLLNLNESERKWLSKHKQLSVGIDPAWKPLEFLDENGEHSGFVASYLDKIELMLDVEFDVVYADSWTETVSMVENSKADFMSLLPIGTAKADKFNFSMPLYEELTLIFSKKGKHTDFELDDFEGKKVGYIASTDALPNSLRKLAIGEKIDINKITGINFATPKDAIKALMSDEIDLYFDDYTVVETTTQKLGITNIEIVGEIPGNNTFHFATPKTTDGATLISILDHALSTISQDEKDAIYKEWIGISKREWNKQQHEVERFRSLVLKLTIGILLTLMIVLIIFLIVYRRRFIEKQRLEKDLRIAKENAEEANRLKSAFLANMSHEIRTPLNSIVGFSNLLSCDEITPEQKKLYSETINTNNLQLLQIIDDILDLSKLESGVITITEEPTDIFYICTDAINTQKANLHEGVELLFDRETKHLVCSTDRKRLLQVLTNFISNSKKFTQKGKIEIGYHLIEDNKLVEFFVSDTGVGIPKENHHLVFKRFHKLNNFAHGTGLGLSICKTIVEKMNGEIRFDSEVDKGTTFYFTIPYNPSVVDEINEKNKILGDCNSNRFITSEPQLSSLKSSNSAAVEKSDRSIENRKKIMIVDDNNDNLSVLSAMLEDDYSLILAHNGQQAVTYTTDGFQSADLILMDVQMPVLDGLKATKIIKEKNIDIPIVMISAYAEKYRDIDYKEYGFEELLDKPINTDHLNRILTKYLA